MRVLLSTYDSRGGVEPLLGLAVRLRELGAEVRMCAPPDCADRLAEVDVPLVPVGPPVHSLVHAAKPPSPADVPRRVAEVSAAAFDKIGVAAEGCAAVLASGVMPAVAAARSVAEKLGIWSTSVSYCPVFLPSPHNRPFPPQWGDQPYFASRVAGLGIGAAHDVKPPTTESLSAALRTALNPATGARAAAVAGTIRTDGATLAATLLLHQFSPERMP